MSSPPSPPVNLDPFSVFLGQSASTPPAGEAPPPTGGSASVMASGPALSPDLPEVLSGSNPLALAANPLLNLIPQIRVMVQHPDPAQLRNRSEEHMSELQSRQYLVCR